MADKKLKNLLRGINTVSVESLSSQFDHVTKCKRKAMDSRQLVDTFSYAEAIVQIVRACGGIKQVSRGAWQRANTKVWSQFQSDLFTWILMMVYHQQESTDKSWPLIFYEYMVNGDATKHNILPPRLVSEYYDMLANTMNCLPPDLQETAEELCRFFECHQVDPYSCVIGQQPSKEILKFSLTISDAALKENLPYDIFSAGAKPSKVNYQQKYEDVLSRIVYWSTISNESAVQNLQQTASSIRGVRRLPRGSLVLARVNDTCKRNNEGEDDCWVYARIAGNTEGSLILLYLSPEESLVVSFEADRVIPVAPEMCSKYFTCDDCVSLEKCVQTNTDRVISTLMEFCNNKVKEYITQAGVSIETLELAMKHMAILKHYYDIKKALDILQRPIPPKLAQEVAQYTSKHINEAIQAAENGPRYQSFQPTYKERIQQLKNFNSKQVLTSEIKQYLGACNSALENIELQKQNILTGVRKDQISSSWLSQIDRVVNAFLVKHGFELDAVPTHYLDEPPASISAVRRNLVLLRRIFSCFKAKQKSKDIFGAQEMQAKLCSTIYKIIAEFISEINWCVALSLDLPNGYIPTSNAQTMESIQNSKLPTKLKEQLVGVLKDKQYLENMKRMETDEQFSKSQRMVTIPVSGLVLSKFCRLENEHNTVLDLWEPARIVRTGGDSNTPLETAVMKNDAKQLEQIFKSGQAYINEQDANGWTALHLACSYLKNLPRLESIEVLLNNPEVDVLSVNNYGNTALHYYAHIPVTEDIRTRYRDIFLKFVTNMELLWVKNHKGETALHRATLSGNSVAARFFLEKGADPNIQNNDGATPLHYAVQSGSIESVAVLVKHYGNHTLPNLNGESPLDIAVKLNHSDLINILSSTEWTKEKLKQANLVAAAGREATRTTQAFNRRTIFQQKNVPEQILDMVNLGNRSSTTGAVPLKLPPVLGSPRSPTHVATKHASLSAGAIIPPILPKEEETVSEPKTGKSSDEGSKSWIKRMNPVKSKMQKVASNMSSNMAKAGAELSSSTSEIRKKLKHEIEKTREQELQATSEVVEQQPEKIVKPRPPIKLPSSNSDESIQISQQLFSGKPSLPAKSEPVKEEKPEYRYALWDATADQPDEISFKKGDRIRVTGKPSAEWWTGELDSGAIGNFPLNYTATEAAYLKSKTYTPPDASQRGGGTGVSRGRRPGSDIRGAANSRGMNRSNSAAHLKKQMGTLPSSASRGPGETRVRQQYGTVRSPSPIGGNRPNDVSVRDQRPARGRRPQSTRIHPLPTPKQ